MKLSRLFKTKVTCFVVLIVALFRFTGIYMYFFQENYFSELTFRSPDITISVQQLRSNQKPDVTPDVALDYGYKVKAVGKCPTNTKVDLLYLVKSAVANYDNRMSIRRTWGIEERFSNRDYVIRTVFLLALPDNSSSYSQADVEVEHNRFGDIIQGNFIDKYYNNTLKTVMGFRWAKKHCQSADFIMFVDDDFYVSTKNVLRLIQDPENYPDDLGSQIAPKLQRKKRQVSEFVDQSWYTGHLFFILPVRFYFNKFFVSIEEYPYNVFPPFINAGAFILTRHTLLNFYYATMYTQPIKLDDVYVGILAKKLGVEPTHNRYFYPYRVPSSKSTYKNLIATHGFRNHQDLIEVWNEQFEYGNA